MTKWEYRIEIINEAGMYTEHPDASGTQDYWAPINYLGSTGWELVSAQWDGDEAIAIFKRAVTDFGADNYVSVKPISVQIDGQGEPQLVVWPKAFPVPENSGVG